ncbi:hypothetical protein NPIL_123531, partial [Nephila pilipes]
LERELAFFYYSFSCLPFTIASSEFFIEGLCEKKSSLSLLISILCDKFEFLAAQTYSRPSAAGAERSKRMYDDEPPAHLFSEHPLSGGADDETVLLADVTSPLQRRR